MGRQRQDTFVIDLTSGKKIKLNGCIPSKKKPPKARHYSATRFADSELPERVDLRQYLTAVEDQAQTNSCTANAIAGAYEYLAMRILGESGDISRLFIYYNARQFDSIEGDNGSSIASSIQVLQEMGACTEETWPYDPEMVDEEPYGEAYEEALRFLIEHAEEVDVDLHAMKHCLAEGYPFVFGLRLFKSFDKARRKGGVPMPNSDETGRDSHGNHAMLCVGYSDPYKVFVVRNSWGESWGDKGYCYIPYDYMTNPDYCFDCWTVKAVSDVDFSANVWAEDDEDFEYYDEEAEGEEGEEEDYEYYETYVTESGDTLWAIAESFYEDGEYWTYIYEANSDLVSEDAEEELEAGIELVIPYDEEEEDEEDEEDEEE